MGAAVMGTAETGGVQAHEIPLAAADGHRYTLLARVPERADRSLFWLPALGVAARHYLPFADALAARGVAVFVHERSEEHTSELQSLMRISYAVFCLKKKKSNITKDKSSRRHSRNAETTNYLHTTR